MLPHSTTWKTMPKSGPKTRAMKHGLPRTARENRPSQARWSFTNDFKRWQGRRATPGFCSNNRKNPECQIRGNAYGRLTFTHLQGLQGAALACSQGQRCITSGSVGHKILYTAFAEWQNRQHLPALEVYKT